MTNLDTYNSSNSVAVYLRETQLQKPESTIINILKSDLSKMKMLDIGVGCGRTTFHFAELVHEYLGIDYAANLINQCLKRFDNKLPNSSFKVLNVINMEGLINNYFDFILFSFNGLDYISHNDRIKALKEIKRVGKNGSYFFFSTHNIKAINNLYKFSIELNISKTIKSIIKYALIWLLNGNNKKYNKMLYTQIIDSSHSFKLKTYYILPSEQIKQLNELGFQDIKLFSITDGKEIIHIESDNITDGYVYYLCKI